MKCEFCKRDVPPWLWAAQDIDGAHYVLLERPMTVRRVEDPAGSPDVIKVVAEQWVGIDLCRNVVRVPHPDGTEEIRPIVLCEQYGCDQQADVHRHPIRPAAHAPTDIAQPPAATGLDRVRAAVERARHPDPPDRPVTLCGGEVDGEQPFWIGDRRYENVEALREENRRAIMGRAATPLAFTHLLEPPRFDGPPPRTSLRARVSRLFGRSSDGEA